MYTCICLAGAGKSQKERSAIRVHPFSICNGLQHLMEDLASVEALGGEGLMLRLGLSIGWGSMQAMNVRSTVYLPGILLLDIVLAEPTTS